MSCVEPVIFTLMQQLLEVKDLKVRFDASATPAVDGISFTLRAGETLGIVGESGSGKSVTSLSVMRLLPKEASVSGSVIYSGKDHPVDFLKLTNPEMRRYRGNDVAMIFQEPMTSLNPVFSCGEQVAEALRLHRGMSKKEARQRTIALFEKVLLPRPAEMYDSYPHQLSGGQKQRVMIAMAMSCDPSVLIADEPTTALDVTVQAAILSLMKDLQREKNTGMIFITHDLGVVAEIADRVLVMYRGKVVEEGKVRDIFLNPGHPYTKGLIACRPPLDRRPRILPTVRDFMREEEGGIVAISSHVTDLVSAEELNKSRADMYSKPPVLKVENVKVHFPVSKGIFGRVTGYVKAVDGVSFDVYPGETLGLVGESGCGKTTLGRAIIRLVELNEGKIYFRGKDFATLGGKELRRMRKHIQIIFQDPYSSLNPRMTIGNAILEPMKVHGLYPGKRRNRVNELLEMVSLGPEHFNRYPHEFSGGQRQRVCIARTMAVNPEFVICDESVSALDVSIQAQILNLINGLKREMNFTCIFISHDLSVVKYMSDRMIVMNRGKIEEIGDPDSIYASPQSDYTRRLIEAIPAGIVKLSSG